MHKLKGAQLSINLTAIIGNYIRQEAIALFLPSMYISDDKMYTQLLLHISSQELTNNNSYQF